MTLRLRFCLTAVLATAVLVAACSRDSTAPTGLNVAGTWSGSVAGGGSSSGTITLVLQQSGTAVTGNFSGSFNTEGTSSASTSASASISGTASGTTFTFSSPQFIDSHGCSAQITSASMTVGGTSMQGIANITQFVSCGSTSSSTVTPTLTLTKQ